MRTRIVLLVTLGLACASMTTRAQMPPQQPLKLADVQKALCLVEKPEPVPQKYKAGFDAITPRETMAMLAYIASDGMEGRDTGSRGYALASDYAASLFRMWGVAPAGDMPPAVPPGRGMFGPSAPAAPRERSYFQDITFKETSDVQSALTLETRGDGGVVRTRTFTAGVDYQGGAGAAETVTAPVVFAGYGISEPALGFDELQGMNLAGKIVLVLTEAPGKGDPKSPFQSKEMKEKYFPPADAQMARMMRRLMGQGGGFDKVAEIAKQKPAAILLVANEGADVTVYNELSAVRVPNDERPIVDRPRTRLTIAGDAGGPMAAMMMGGGGTSIAITREIADAILAGTGKTIDELKRAIETTMKPASRELPGVALTVNTTSKTRLLRCRNVLGVIEGSDPALKHEYFVIGAHFDHTGRFGDYIYNGADDNGSGSVGVMAIARAMALNPVKPKRSVVFALWTGEEKGLFGSRYYVSHPPFAIAKTVGYLNYDMISRAFDAPTLARSTRQYDVEGAADLVKRIRGERFATVNLTAGTEFIPLTREMNKYVGLDLALRENPLGVGMGGSDHASFAAVKVPYVYYMAAMTADYHQPGDSVEKVNPELFTKIVQMGYLTAFAFADR